MRPWRIDVHDEIVSGSGGHTRVEQIDALGVVEVNGRVGYIMALVYSDFNI